MTELEHLLLSALERWQSEWTARENELVGLLNDVAAQLATSEKDIRSLAGQLTSLSEQVNHLTAGLEKLQAALPKASATSKGGR